MWKAYHCIYVMCYIFDKKKYQLCESLKLVINDKGDFMLIILQWWFSDILFFLSFTKNQAVTSSGVYYMYLCLESCLWIIVLLVLQWQWLQYKSINEAVKDLCRSLAQSLTQSIYNKIQLLRATSSQILSICKSGDSTASLDNLCQWLTTLTVKKIQQ